MTNDETARSLISTDHPLFDIHHSCFVIRHSCFVIHLVCHHTLPTKNGLCAFSSPTVVIGPWPGQMTVSSGSVKIFSRLFRNASSYETFPPPIDPAKSESPTIAIGRESPVTT